ncbi:MAG: right-handed parallel beta-helix repeat-containing protein [Candidatus Heimdallarchaeota archaeon]
MGKQPFSIIFLTALSIATFGGFALVSTSLMADVWEIAESNDWITAIKDSVAAGDTVMFITDGGSYMTPTSGYLPAKELVLMAKPGLTNKPVLSTNDGGYVAKVNANLTVISLAFNGLWAENGSTSTFRMLYLNKDIDKLVVEDCDFYNIRGRAIDGKTFRVDTLIVNNSRFWDFNNEAIRIIESPPQIKTATITNSSFWNVKMGVYIQDIEDTLEVSHSTFFNTAERSIYAREDTNAVIRDNIFVSSGDTGKAAVMVYGPTPVVEYNLFWDNVEDIDSTNATLVSTTGNVFADPVFEDTSAATFSLALALSASPAIGTASDGGNMGDPNWGTFNDLADVTLWEVTADPTDWYAPIKGFLTAGDTVKFVTDGGVYFSPGSITLPKVPLTLMAKPGLSEKPLLTAAFSSSRIIKIQAATTFKGLRFKGDGILEGTPYGVRFDKKDNDLGTVIFEDCEFSEFRLRGIHLDKLNHTDTLIVNNCIFREIGESGMREKNTSRNVEVAKITNSTFYKIGEQGIRLQNVGELEVSHCTFVLADTTISGRAGRGVYARDDTVVIIRNNIFAYIQEKAVRVYGPSPTVEYNLFWQNGQNIVPEDDSTLTFPIFNFDADPVFKDTSAANLNLALEVNTSPAIGTASDGTNLGDPRWGTWNITGVEDNDLIPKTYRLSQNYPNPFNPETRIEYDLPKKSEVKLTIYNMLGQKVVTLVNKEQVAGSHSVHWDGTNDKGVKVSSGLYLYRIEAGDFIRTKKMLLLK